MTGAVIISTRVDPALQQELQKIVEALSAPGKGILSIDESPSSLDAKFREINVENTEITRRDYREMILSADKVVKKNSDPVVQLKGNLKIFQHNFNIAFKISYSPNYRNL